MKLCLTMLLVLIAADEAPRFKTTTTKAEDAVTMQSEAGKVVFLVRSVSGIGGAVIERTGAKWPEAVVLKLQLKGLENLVLANGTTSLGAAVSSNDGKA